MDPERHARLACDGSKGSGADACEVEILPEEVGLKWTRIRAYPLGQLLVLLQQIHHPVDTVDINSLVRIDFQI
jgi:hypothetical protein